MANLESGGSVGVDYTYKQLMATTYADWSKNRLAYADQIEAKRKSGKFTEAEVIAIWKHYEALVKAKQDAATAAGAKPINIGSWSSEPEPTMWDKINAAMSAASTKFRDDLSGIGDKLKDPLGVGSAGKYIVIGIAGLVLILILGRK